eukprot:scaffold11197_cov45-Phaeocystis_antarctica.AAC.1
MRWHPMLGSKHPGPQLSLHPGPVSTGRSQQGIAGGAGGAFGGAGGGGIEGGNGSDGGAGIEGGGAGGNSMRIECESTVMPSALQATMNPQWPRLE